MVEFPGISTFSPANTAAVVRVKNNSMRIIVLKVFVSMCSP